MAEEVKTSETETKFQGHFEVKFDSKNRLAIPERFVRVLAAVCPDQKDRVGLIPAGDHSFKLVTVPAFKERVNYWESLDDRLEDHQAILEIEMFLAKEIPMDAQHRIRLTDLQAEHCGLKESALIVGRGGFMQVYDLDAFKARRPAVAKTYREANNREAMREKGIQPPPNQFVIEARPKD